MRRKTRIHMCEKTTILSQLGKPQAADLGLEVLKHSMHALARRAATAAA